MISDSHLPTSECFSVHMIVQTSRSTAFLYGLVLGNRGLPGPEEWIERHDVGGWNGAPGKSPLL